SRTNTIINNTNTSITQLEELRKRLDHSEGFDESLRDDIKDALERISDLQDDVLKRPPPNMGYRQRPRLREEIRSLMRAINGATARPTQPQLHRLEQLSSEVAEAQALLDQIIATDIQQINDKAQQIPQISIGTKSEG
ncbi:MAG: hypothetical protein AAFR36_32895, partial [Bacteroidota bacterium]